MNKIVSWFQYIWIFIVFLLFFSGRRKLEAVHGELWHCNHWRREFRCCKWFNEDDTWTSATTRLNAGLPPTWKKKIDCVRPTAVTAWRPASGLIMSVNITLFMWEWQLCSESGLIMSVNIMSVNITLFMWEWQLCSESGLIMSVNITLFMWECMLWEGEEKPECFQNIVPMHWNGKIQWTCKWAGWGEYLIHRPQ